MHAYPKSIFLLLAVGLSTRMLQVVALAGESAPPVMEASHGQQKTPFNWTHQAFASTETGYDSNLDGSRTAVGSAYVRVEGGLDVSAKTDVEHYLMQLRFQDHRFTDLERKDRWDMKAVLAADYQLGEGRSIDLEAQYIRDYYSLHPAEIWFNTANFVKKFDTGKLHLRAKSTVERSLAGVAGTDIDGDDDNSGSTDDDALQEMLTGIETSEDNTDLNYFTTPRSKEFDFARSEVYVSVLANTEGSLQPFLIGDAADLAYFGQSPAALIDRNAKEQYGVAGVRIVASSKLWMDIGYRYNYRNFADRRVTKFSSQSPDVQINWKVTPDFKILGGFERIIREPTTFVALADDVRAITVSASWQMAPALRLDAKAVYDQIEGVGDVLKHDKLYGKAEFFYTPVERFEIFTKFLARQVREDHFDTLTERWRISAGATVKF